MTDLASLFRHHLTDKDANGYTEAYTALFEPIRHQPLTLLEIGVGTVTPDVLSSMRFVYPEGHPYRPGASLRAWRDYFPNGRIYGGDVQPDCYFEDDRIQVRLFNSMSRDACDATLGDLTFDIIIDDGLHTEQANVATLRNLWHRLTPGGIYTIEDVHPPLYHRWQDVFADLDAEMTAHDNGRWAMLIFRKPV